jgi:hypothetical protein
MGTMALQPLTEGVYIHRGNLIVKEQYALYVFCQCGGLKTFHLLEPESPSHSMMLSSAIWRACECHKSKLYPAKTLDTDQALTRILNDLARAIKNTISTAKTVEDAGNKAEQLIWRLASQQEMK